MDANAKAVSGFPGRAPSVGRPQARAGWEPAAAGRLPRACRDRTTHAPWSSIEARPTGVGQVSGHDRPDEIGRVTRRSADYAYANPPYEQGDLQPGIVGKGAHVAPVRHAEDRVRAFAHPTEFLP